MMEVVVVELDPNDLHRTEALMKEHGFRVLESETVEGTSFVKVGVQDPYDALDEVTDFLNNNSISAYVDYSD